MTQLIRLKCAGRDGVKRRNNALLWAVVLLCQILIVALYHEVVKPIMPTPQWAHEEMTRPGVDVILGGDRVVVGPCGNKFYLGTISFYTTEGIAVCFAHGVPTQLGSNTLVRSPDDAIIPEARAIANTEAGVVLKGMPLPEARQVLPLGGTADIAFDAKAVVYPMDAEPFQVTVKKFTMHNGYLHVLLVPDTFSGRLKPGRSGSPVVQNGAIIAFTSFGVTYGSTFQAIVAGELYESVKPYLRVDR